MPVYSASDTLTSRGISMLRNRPRAAEGGREGGRGQGGIAYCKMVVEMKIVGLSVILCK